MVSRTKIFTITVPKYIRRVRISDKVRPKYWEWDGTTIKCGSKKLLKKYINSKCKKDIILNNGNILPQYLIEGFYIVGFKGDKVYQQMHSVNQYASTSVVLTNDFTTKQLQKKTKYYLCSETREGYEKVIANPTKVNLPRYEIISGQNIYNSTANPFIIGKLFDAIKEMYYRKFKNINEYSLQLMREKIKESYPVIIELELFDTVKSAFDNSKNNIGRRWDVGNRTDPYMKTFLDFLTNGLYDIDPIIEDDDRLHVTSGNNSFFTPVDSAKERQLVFHIYTDNRKLLFKPYLENDNKEGI